MVRVQGAAWIHTERIDAGHKPSKGARRMDSQLMTYYMAEQTARDGIDRRATRKWLAVEAADRRNHRAMAMYTRWAKLFWRRTMQLFLLHGRDSLSDLREPGTS
jgi:hypothetical protein